MDECQICGEKYTGVFNRCKRCLDSMRACDRPTYDLVLGLLKRIEAVQKRCDDLERRIVGIDG